ncbi:MAG: hypothetical protein K0R00_34 [Herbinix sp.]|jgi:uncharacterized membrane protein (DUF485 family)|nr:hypothetical protein [Herbinix sp.]
MTRKEMFVNWAVTTSGVYFINVMMFSFTNDMMAFRAINPTAYTAVGIGQIIADVILIIALSRYLFKRKSK